jgi:hypothetical protein
LDFFTTLTSFTLETLRSLFTVTLQLYVFPATFALILQVPVLPFVRTVTICWFFPLLPKTETIRLSVEVHFTFAPASNTFSCSVMFGYMVSLSFEILHCSTGSVDFASALSPWAAMLPAMHRSAIASANTFLLLSLFAALTILSLTILSFINTSFLPSPSL